MLAFTLAACVRSVDNLSPARQPSRKRRTAWGTACSLTRPAKLNPKAAQHAFMRLSSQ